MSKRYYKARMLKRFRYIIALLLVFFLFILYQSTLTDPTFLKKGDLSLKSVISFHLMYPEELLTFIIVVLIPAIYFAFIRGTIFYEDKVQFNHGVPFVNTSITYDQIKLYRILHPKYLISIETKSDKQYLVTTNDIDRAISILDKEGIKGKLDDEEYTKAKASQKKAFVYLLVFVMVMLALQKWGAFRWLYRG